MPSGMALTKSLTRMSISYHRDVDFISLKCPSQRIFPVRPNELYLHRSVSKPLRSEYEVASIGYPFRI